MTELPLKTWLAEEAIREHSQPRAIYMRLIRGKYPGVKVRRVNRKVVFVQVPERKK